MQMYIFAGALILFCGSTVNLVGTSGIGWSEEKCPLRFLIIGKTCILTQEWFFTKSILLF